MAIKGKALRFFIGDKCIGTVEAFPLEPINMEETFEIKPTRSLGMQFQMQGYFTDVGRAEILAAWLKANHPEEFYP